MKVKLKPPGIYLGYPFDQLFDRDCDLEYWKGSVSEKRAFIPAIKLPTDRSPGTGNIVITGPPGSGKSNLAVQWAVKCALRPDNASNAAYFSFEQTIDEVISKARPFGWHRWMRRMRLLHEIDELGNPEDSDEFLWNILLGRTNMEATFADIRKRIEEARKDPEEIDNAMDGGDPTRRLLLCALSPRPIAEGTTHEELFWRRYQHLEHLLSAADRLSHQIQESKPRSKEGDLERLLVIKKAMHKLAIPQAMSKTIESYPQPRNIFLPVVVLDSLNMFGMKPLNREEVFRLFSLFRKYRRTGIFVVESNQDTPFDSTMADVVVSLSNHKENGGYLVHHLEIQKSRYFNQVNGLHPYKPSSMPLGKNKPLPLAHPMPYENHWTPRNQGLIVYPSLHYIVLRTEQIETETRSTKPLNEPERFCIGAMGVILPPLHRQSVITIEGASGTCKTKIAMNFLAAGLNNGESALLIRLGDVPLLQEDRKPIRISRELAGKGFRWEDWKQVKEEFQEGARWSNLVARHKTTVSVWRNYAKNGPPMEPTLFELDFKGGALLPEEFVQIIRDFLNRLPVKDKHYEKQHDKQRIRRVVLDDVGQIGISYPFLRHSLTTGDTFLSAFVHIMRNAGVDLVMTASTTGLPQADEMVIRACSLADAVISCSYCDVFGERHVLVRRKGIVAGQTEKQLADQSHEPAPAVVRLSDGAEENRPTFHLDQDYLAGLVGFDSGHIHRPGLLLHLFQGNEIIQGKYNESLETALRAGFASGPLHINSGQPDQARGVAIAPFAASSAGSIHAAIQSFHSQEKPLDRTVLFTVDEFGAPIHKLRDPEVLNQVRKQWSPVAGAVDWKDFQLATDSNIELPDGKWPGLFWPYYSNVLLMAYRMDGCDDNTRLSFESWEDVLTQATSILAKCGTLSSDPSPPTDRNHLPTVRRAFWVDLDAPESLACTLLDALHVAHGRKGFEFLHKERETDFQSQLTEEETKEVTAITSLFHMTAPGDAKSLPEDSGSLMDNKEKNYKASETPPDDAGVYVLWYSQLRELIERRPALGAQLNVCALPGLGFRGDWFLGVVRGSVSPSLGQRIVEFLCGHEEDKRRYVSGVGLPARKSFYKPEFYGWPRGCHVTLPDLWTIWKPAYNRGRIDQYEVIRHSIYALARQLTPLAGSAPGGNIQAVMDTTNVGRLFAQIRSLTSAKYTCPLSTTTCNPRASDATRTDSRE